MLGGNYYMAFLQIDFLQEVEYNGLTTISDLLDEHNVIATHNLHTHNKRKWNKNGYTKEQSTDPPISDHFGSMGNSDRKKFG